MRKSAISVTEDFSKKTRESRQELRKMWAQKREKWRVQDSLSKCASTMLLINRTKQHDSLNILNMPGAHNEIYHF